MFTRKKNNKHKCILFSRLLTTSANNIMTNKCTYNTVIESGMVTETSDASQRSNVYIRYWYKMLSYRRETALQRAL